MRYQYTSSGFNERFNQPIINIPNGVKALLIINLIVFILIEISGYKNFIFITFGLIPHMVWSQFKIWQLFTYLFIHGGIFHIFFNMFVLWMFGKELEIKWGKNLFFIFYFLCGIGSGFITVLFNFSSFVPIVGSSGAIYGLLVAYGLTYPNKMVYLYGILPFKVKHIVLCLGLIAFFASLSTSQSNVSHITHLSGMIIGLIILYSNFSWSNIELWYYKYKLKIIRSYKSKKNIDEKNMKKKVDKILEKLNDNGWESLTEKEEKYLNNASKNFFKDRSPN